MPAQDPLDTAFTELKASFNAVAERNSGDIRDLILHAADALTVKPGDDDGDAIERMAETYEDLLDELEVKAITDPRAAKALDDLGAAVSKTMARVMSM